MRFRPLGAAVLLGCWSAVVSAGSFTVNPVRLELPAGASATSLKISNASDRPELLQVSLWRWTQDDGQDHYQPEQSDDGPIVTPPLFRLEPLTGAQIVRIGFDKAPPPGPEERAWRVIIEEVPQPGIDDASAGAITMRMRISLPLLLAPLAPHQDLRWEGQSHGGGATLIARNAGNVSERIDELLVKAAHGGATLARYAGPIYLLPGQSRRFEFQAATGAGSGTVTLTLQGTPRTLTSDLVLRAQ